MPYHIKPTANLKQEVQTRKRRLREASFSLKNSHLKHDTKGPRRKEGMDVNLPTGYSQPFYLWKRPGITELWDKH